ncbi:hypothetical protein T265_13386, partial [Opisthorchis viverrini]
LCKRLCLRILVRNCALDVGSERFTVRAGSFKMIRLYPRWHTGFSVVKSLFRTVFTALTATVPKTTLVATEFYRQPLPRTCVAFASDQGKRIFREALSAGHMEAYFPLAEQLCTQAEPAYCGLATLVMVLNAFEMDPGRIWKGPWRWYHESMLDCCIPSDVLSQGITLDKFVEIARCHGLEVDLHRVRSSDQLSAFREVVSTMTSSEHKGYLVTCFARGSLGQTGTGHFAAVGGYHPQRELVFLFDTARFKYPSHWAPIARLWEGMAQLDSVTKQPRGYMIITRSSVLGRRNIAEQADSTVEDRLYLFGISDSARQAYLSPAALCGRNSVGRRLRVVADSWLQWIRDEVPEEQSHQSAVIGAAARFILDACPKHSLYNFFLTVQPFVDEEQQGPVRDAQQKVVKDLLASQLGQIVTSIVNSLPKDQFEWLTTVGPFRLATGRSYASSTKTYVRSSPICPFAELSDPGLRLSLLLTSFICSYPYAEISKLTNGITKNTRVHLLREVFECAKFSDATLTELQVLRNVLWSFISTGLQQTEAPSPCCNTI